MTCKKYFKLLPILISIGIFHFENTLFFDHAMMISSEKVDFFRDIQPIFKKKCLSCHGLSKQMATLSLDSKESASLGGQSGSVIEPGNAEKSLLFQRVVGVGDQARMPMGDEPLTKSAIKLIQTWIDQGAVWPDSLVSKKAKIDQHWAYFAPFRPDPPKTTHADWIVNPIDNFVLSRLEAQGLSPSPEADRVTLLRRLSLDLIGLPPSIEELDAFLADRSNEAFERQVDRLLQSPHYGERWGRHWLDAARYADSDGFEKDSPRVVWFYRDWVIKSLNQDMPYDQFITEQLAGDMLPNATQDQLVATGFLRNSMMNREGGIDPEQFRMEAMFDRMEAIGKGILGITIQCAQCHNHKYDPLTQEEYYQLFAFVNNANEAKVAVYNPSEEKQRRDLRQKIQKIESHLKHKHPNWQEKMNQWELGLNKSLPDWVVIQPEVEDFSTGGSKYLPLKDGSFLVQGSISGGRRAEMTEKTNMRNIKAFRLELLTDNNLPLGGPGRASNGTVALTEFEVEVAPANNPDSRTKVTIANATADIVPIPIELPPQDDKAKTRIIGPVSFAIDGKEETAWGIDNGSVKRSQPRKAVFTVDKPIDLPNGALLTFYLSQKHGGPGSENKNIGNRNLGRFRISITTTDNAKADPLPKAVREILSVPKNKRTSEQIQSIFSYWRTTVPEWDRFNVQIEKLWRQHPEGGATQLVFLEREDPRPTHILARGDFLKPGRQVYPQVPKFLHPLPQDVSLNRLTFARWLVDRKSPTTARTLVNRVWQNYYGTGLVRSSEDLGKQSEAPSHPKLLDWLAVEFMDQGWSLKKLHRIIVNSATYKQSSRAPSEQYREDPYNIFLARGPRIRVDAEIVRDIALAASGLLNPKIGGPSVYSPAPKFLFERPASFSKKTWNEAKGKDRYRRALYTFRYRSVPYPMLQNFDAPTGESSCVRRTRSNTPLQALTTLNEPVFLEAARALALRTLRHGGKTQEKRLNYAFRRCVSREPSQAEIIKLLNFFDRQKRRLAEGWVSPWDMAGYDTSALLKLPKEITPVQLAAWTAVSRVLLNLDETITKE